MISKAIDAFWASIASSHPEITSGDCDPMAHAHFEQQCEAIVKHWLELNTPTHEQKLLCRIADRLRAQAMRGNEIDVLSKFNDSDFLLDIGLTVDETKYIVETRDA